MNQIDPLKRGDCPVKPLGIDADGMYVFLNDRSELITLDAESIGTDEFFEALFTKEESLYWARLQKRSSCGSTKHVPQGSL